MSLSAWVFHKMLAIKILFSCSSLILSLAIAPEAFAQTIQINSSTAGSVVTVTGKGTQAYKPPANPSAPGQGSTTPTGRRGGCSGDKKTALTALAPHSHVGQTVSTHPTFAWFVPDAQSYDLIFQLYKLGTGRKSEIIYSTKMQSKQGIMQLSLPKDTPGLSIGERYVWQVVVLCNPNHPSTALVARAEIEMVRLPSVVQQQLSSTTDALARAKLYGQASFWYDALEETLQAPENRQSKELQMELLQAIASSEKNQAQQNRLQQIIALER